MSDAPTVTVLDSVIARTDRTRHDEAPDTKIEFKGGGSTEVYSFNQILDIGYRNGLVGFEYPHAPVLTAAADGSPLIVVTVYALWADGTKSAGIGDAGPSNCNSRVATSFPRMADTRAKGRAVAHGLNLGKNVAEEFGPDPERRPWVRPQQQQPLIYGQRTAPATERTGWELCL